MGRGGYKHEITLKTSFPPLLPYGSRVPSGSTPNSLLCSTSLLATPQTSPHLPPFPTLWMLGANGGSGEARDGVLLSWCYRQRGDGLSPFPKGKESKDGVKGKLKGDLQSNCGRNQGWGTVPLLLTLVFQLSRASWGAQKLWSNAGCEEPLWELRSLLTSLFTWDRAATETHGVTSTTGITPTLRG